MASVTLKNLPEDLLRELRAAAERDHRSLHQEIVYLLASALRRHHEPPSFEPSHVKAQVQAWRDLAGTWESELDFEAEVEQLVRSRTLGRDVDLEEDEDP